MYYLEKLISLLTSIKETEPFKTFERARDYVWYFILLTLLAIFLAYQTYKYIEFRQSHTLVEATITEHVWKNERLVLRYSYLVDGLSYEGNSGPYGEEIKHRRHKPGGGYVIDRKSASTIAEECPVNSKHQIYYQDNNPKITQFA